MTATDAARSVLSEIDMMSSLISSTSNNTELVEAVKVYR